MNRIYDESKELTKKLVRIASVNTTSGEKEIAVSIEQYIREIPYFQKHPDQVIIQHLKNDALDRRNVIAYIKGEKRKDAKTILLHGHMDTVGTEDYGSLEPYCNDPDRLLTEMLKMDLAQELRNDLESGDYMPGRGACDMKSGVAVHLVLLKYLSEQVKQLSGNIVVSVNPVEENLHTGIIEGLSVLRDLQKEEGFQYLFAINNDYTCPLFQGDTKRYIYTGAVGKLLPCFYIQGMETHVGQAYNGFDASRVAAELVRLIHLNPEFIDGYESEYTLPPSVLKMKDLKPWYNVQTAQDAFVYFNHFVHNASMEEIIAGYKKAANKALKNTLESINQSYREYSKLTNTKERTIQYDCKVMTYKELYDLAVERLGRKITEKVKEETRKLTEANTDKREIPMYLVKLLLRELGIKQPVIVLFFAAPYCPHNTLKSEDAKEKELLSFLEEVIGEFEKESGEEYEILRFFPSLTDSSYLKIDDTKESTSQLIENFPEYDSLYAVPLDEIKALNIPAINYGVYGKDAHRWMERVYMPYSFGVLPKLILNTIEKIMK